MKADLKLRILKTYGIAQDSCDLGCYVWVDGVLKDVMAPLNADYEENHCCFKGSQAKLVVKQMGKNEKILGTAYLDCTDLPNHFEQWLDLDPNSFELNSAKVLISVWKLTKAPSEACLMPEIKLFNEQQEISVIGNFETFGDEETTQRRLEDECLDEETFDKQDELFLQLNSLNKKNLELSQSLLKTQTQLVHLKTTNENLVDQVNELKLQLEASKSLSEEIEFYKQQLEQSETQRQNLQRIIQDLNAGYNFNPDGSMKHLLAENRKLKSEVKSLRSQLAPERMPLQRPKVTNNFSDQSFKNYLRDLKLESFFERQNDNFYVVGGKLVQIINKQGEFFVRLGGTYCNVQTFVKEYVLPKKNQIRKISSVSAVHNRSKSLDFNLKDSDRCFSSKIQGKKLETKETALQKADKILQQKLLV